MIRTVKAVSASFLVLLLSAICFGQGGAATGDLHVTVKDAKGALIANATVTVRDTAKGLERTATGNGEGGYSAQLLPARDVRSNDRCRRFQRSPKHRSRDHSRRIGRTSGYALHCNRKDSGRSQFASGAGGNLAQFHD
jgi:hypothetical protein